MSVEVIVLGIAQDAGVPQAGSLRGMSLRAWTDPAARKMAACIGIVHRESKRMWMLDATPDFKWQWHALQTFAPECALAGIFISHCHIGHYTGLIHLGKEAWNTRGMPLIATSRVLGFLQQNGPWSQLFALGNVESVILDDGPFAMADGAHIHAMRVPHRGEFSDTVAYSIRGQRSLFYCPDIDRWEEWDKRVRDVVDSHDHALIDGSFFSGDELPGRDMSKIPHPTVMHTAGMLAGSRSDVRFTHLNHSNPLLDATSEASTWLRSQGLGVAAEGDVFAL